MAAWRSVQPWSVRYGMRCTIAALIAPIDRVKAIGEAEHRRVTNRAPAVGTGASAVGR